MKPYCTKVILCLLLAGPASAQPDFFDDLESGGGNWTQWPEATDSLSLIEVDASNGEHARSGGSMPSVGGCADSVGAHALKQQVPTGLQSYASYADFGAASGRVYAEVWVREEFNNDGTNPAQPVSNLLAVVAGTPDGGGGWTYTDYLEIGVMPDGPGGSQGYSIRTKYNDDHSLGYIDPAVARQGTWLRLVIQADALADGGQVRFYIQDELVGTSYRTAGVDLQYVVVGSTAASYEDFWYDDAKVIDEFPPEAAFFFDDLEIGVRSTRWKKWPEASEALESTCIHSHTRYGLKSGLVVRIDPWSYASYADFGATSGAVYAETYLLDDFQNDGTNYDEPVSIGLALIGAAPEASDYTDYLQFGVVSYWYPDGLTDTYGYRTKHRDDNQGWPGNPLNCVETGVSRKAGWTKLAIAAEALADGGKVRFLIDDEVVGTSYRKAGVDLQYVRLGVNWKSYEWFWYDDVLVTDVLPSDDFLRFDVDDDGDVDQEDFAAFQTCYTGSTATYDRADCWRMDADDDTHVDEDDWDAFEACASGPGIIAEIACDD